MFKMYKGTNRKIIVDPFDSDQIFVEGFSLDNGNIDIWVNEAEDNYNVTQEEARINAEMIVSAFDAAQRFGSIHELELMYKEAVNALKFTRAFLDLRPKGRYMDPVLDAMINRALKRDKLKEEKS